MSIKKNSSIDSKELLKSILKNRTNQIDKNRSRKRRVTPRNIEKLKQKINKNVESLNTLLKTKQHERDQKKSLQMINEIESMKNLLRNSKNKSIKNIKNKKSRISSRSRAATRKHIERIKKATKNRRKKFI